MERNMAENGMQKICKHHKPLCLELPYVRWFREADKKKKKGIGQTQCPICRRWFWEDEMGTPRVMEKLKMKYHPPCKEAD